MLCETTCLLKPVHASLDRLQEAHYWLHEMEAKYHDPEPFRFASYAAIRVLGETFDVLNTECVRHDRQMRGHFKTLHNNLQANVLANQIRAARNQLCHVGNLEFSDNLALGNGSAAKMRNSLAAQSDIHAPTKALTDQRNIFVDEDFQSCAFRQWFVQEIESQAEIVEVLFSHWLTLAGLVERTVRLLDLGIETPTFDLQCRQDRNYDFRIFIY